MIKNNNDTSIFTPNIKTRHIRGIKTPLSTSGGLLQYVQKSTPKHYFRREEIFSSKAVLQDGLWLAAWCLHILLSLCSSQKSRLNQRSLFYWRHLLFPELLLSPIREGGATWNFISLEIQTFKDVFIKCKILIFFYFSKMQQKCFMLDTIQPFTESINPDGKKERVIQTHPFLFTVL